MTNLSTTILAALTDRNDPRFAEDIAHLQRLIAEADANDRPAPTNDRNALTMPSTEISIAHL